MMQTTASAPAAHEQLDNKEHLSRAVETSVHVGLVILLAAACFLILRPFLVLIAWGTIVAIALYPGFRKVQLLLGGRGVLSAVLLTVVLLGCLILPAVLLTGTLIGGINSVVSHVKDGTLTIPPPPAKVETWPVIGVPLKNAWTAASVNMSSALRSFAPQIKAILPSLLSASAGIGLTVLLFALSILVAGFLLATAPAGAAVAHSLAKRFFGDDGPEVEQLIASTTRSVTTGIIGVAFIQSVLAGLGFLVAGLPGAGLWTAVFLFAAVLQVGALVLVPAVIYVFMTASVTKAVIFLVWCLIVALSDNILKPLLLGRGVAVPVAVVFLGAIGGFLAMGILGLFVGAIVLSVGYKVFLAWLNRTPAAHQEA
jgi:predicted PurR-regulated permease PerM